MTMTLVERLRADADEMTKAAYRDYSPPLGDAIRATYLRWGADKLREAAERIEALERWHPIATAPKDGTWVLVWSRMGSEDVWRATYRSSRDAWWNGDSVVRATHWRPLPSPPQEKL